MLSNIFNLDITHFKRLLSQCYKDISNTPVPYHCATVMSPKAVRQFISLKVIIETEMHSMAGNWAIYRILS